MNVSPELSDATVPIFMGYEAIVLESIVKMFRNKIDHSACYFLREFIGLRDNLTVPEDNTEYDELEIDVPEIWSEKFEAIA